MIEERLASHNAVCRLLKEYGLQPKKGLGQNFITDSRVVAKMVDAAGITRDDRVIEIGPGLGGLTQVLAEKAASVLAVELDISLSDVLTDVFDGDDRVEILRGDFLKIDLCALMASRGWRTVKIAANLPYYITSSVIESLLESSRPIESITVMAQKEAAERLTAKPGGRAYGVLSLLAAYRADIRIDANVPRNCFFPRPHVDSVIATLRLIGPKAEQGDEEVLFKCIKAAFGQRRKTLLNCLRSQDWIGLDREGLAELLTDCGFDHDIRGEALPLDDFIRLARKLNSRLHHSMNAGI